MTKSEWMVIAPYFDTNNYRADKVLDTLQNNHPLYQKSIAISEKEI
jgi:hypothetical protein